MVLCLPGLKGLTSRQSLSTWIDSIHYSAEKLVKRVLSLAGVKTKLSWFKEAVIASKLLHHGASLHNPREGGTTALMEPLRKQKKGWALVNLYGCSSLVIVSKYGVYMSHYWQVQSFNREIALDQDGKGKEVKWVVYDPIQFQKDILNTMSNGVGMGEEKGFCRGTSRVDYFIRDDADTQAVIFSPGLPFAEGFLYKERVESMD